MDFCVVCQQDMTVGDGTIKLRCGHSFHAPCIVEALQKHDHRCPICRDDPRQPDAATAGPPPISLSAAIELATQHVHSDARVRNSLLTSARWSHEIAKIERKLKTLQRLLDAKRHVLLTKARLKYLVENQESLCEARLLAKRLGRAKRLRRRCHERIARRYGYMPRA